MWKNLLLVVMLFSFSSAYADCTYGDFEPCLAEAKQDDATAQYELGKMYHHGVGIEQDYKKSVKWFRKSAEQGNPIGEYSLGVLYFNGVGVAQDYKEAIKWYHKAAAQGEVGAQTNLAILYHTGGGGLTLDYKEAIKWYQKAAEQGNAISQHHLGVMYFKGSGVSQDYIMAHVWANLAAANGAQGAASDRDIVAEKMTPAQLAGAQKLATEWMDNQ